MAFSAPKGLIVGFHMGSLVGGILQTPQTGSYEFWFHDPKTFQALWDEVGKETGTKWQCEAALKTNEEIGWSKDSTSFLPEENTRVMCFVVRRLE